MLHKIISLLVSLALSGHIGAYEVEKIENGRIYYNDTSTVTKSVEVPYPSCETAHGRWVILVDGEYGGMVK